MIQRVQSLYLLAAALLAALLFVLPLVEYDRVDHLRFTLTVLGLSTADGVPVTDVSLKLPLHVLTGILAGMLLACIFFFKDRPRQVRFVRFTYLVAVALLVAEWITHGSVRAYLEQESNLGYTLLPAFYLPFGCIVLGLLAERAIKKDEALVRSADRLR